MKKLIFLYALLSFFELSFAGNIIWKNQGYLQWISTAVISNDINYLAVGKYTHNYSNMQYWDLLNKKKIYQDTFSSSRADFSNDNKLIYFIYKNKLIVKNFINNSIITQDTIPYDVYSIRRIPNSPSKIMMRISKDDGWNALYSIYNYKSHQFEDEISFNKGNDYVNADDIFIISPDGKFLVFNYFTMYSQRDTAPYNMVYIYNLQTKELKSKAVQNSHIHCMNISDDSRYLITVSASKSSIAYWDLIQGDTIKTISITDIYPRASKFIDDSHFLLFDYNDSKLHYYDLTNDSDKAFAEIKDYFNYGYFVGDSIFIAVDGNSIKYWSYSYGNNPFIQLDTTLIDIKTDNHISGLNSVDISPDNSLIVSGGNDKVVKVWDSQSGAFLYNLSSQIPTYINALKFSHKGDKIAWVSQNPIHALTISTIEKNNTAFQIQNINPVLNCISWSNDDKSIAVAGYGDSIYIFNAASGQVTYSIPANKQWINTITFSSDDKLLVYGNIDGSLNVWDLANNNLIYNDTIVNQNSIYDFDFSKDGNYLLVSCGDGFARVLRTTDWYVVKQFSSHTEYNNIKLNWGSVFKARYSPDSKYIISNIFQAFMKVWDNSTGDVIKIYDDVYDYFDFGIIKDIAIAHDGSYIASVSNTGDVVKWAGWIETDVKEPQNLDNECIYPNPISDYLYIKNQDIFNSNIQIYNSLGIKAIEMDYQSKIDVRDLAPGLYFLRMEGKIYKFIKL
jgi:WD40 repeat protein